jgi:hypothetical protein
MKTLFAILLFPCLLFASDNSRTAGPPQQTLIIGVSPFLEKNVKEDVYRTIIHLIVEDMPLNSTLTIYDAFDLKTITRVALPDARVFASPKTRANQFAGAVRDLKSFLVSEHPKPVHARLNFVDAIQVPQFIDFVSHNLTTTNPSPIVLLLGSPLYQDAKEPLFSMVDGYFPSDGHLLATREKSVFGSDGATNTPLMVNWVYFGDPWVNDLHKERVTRFWTLYFSCRSSRLTAFSGDFPTVLQAFCKPQTESAAVTKRYSLDSEQTKIEMLRVSREVDVADWLTREAPMAQKPPSVMVGPMKIGIRWKENVDLDLYAAAHSGAETLFFQHTRSPEGYYYKDHRSSPGREYEFVEFETPVDIREVEASVNFYKGHWPGGARGEVRIEFDGRIYGAPFFIEATEGNRGRSGSEQQEYWTRIPVQEILKLKLAAAAR